MTECHLAFTIVHSLSANTSRGPTTIIMSVQFAALMALSRTHTQEQQSVVANQLTERKRKEEEQRKKRLERERKELELEKKRRMQHFENLKREDERQKEKSEKEKALEAERERRAQAQLDVLRYGPKKAVAKYPARANPHSVDDNKSRAEALTREELRERKRLAEQRRMLAPSKRTFHHTGTRKPGKRLPGGAIDTTASLPATASTSAQTTRERIAAIPPTLVKLNQVKRDLRTIDEIQTQLKNAKALEGDQARSFGDYFVDRKKDSVAKPKQSPTPRKCVGIQEPFGLIQLKLYRLKPCSKRLHLFPRHRRHQRLLSLLLPLV